MGNVDNILLLNNVASTVNHDKNGKFVKGESKRLELIKELLSETDYELVEKDLFLICSKKPISEIKGTVTVISSHIDTVSEITKPFSIEISDKKLLGTYDNSITNSAIITGMLENKFSEDVVIVFTGNEENGMKGARNVCEFIKKEGINPKVIVTDVTYKGFKGKKHFTVENEGNSGEWTNKIKDAFVAAKFKWKNKDNYYDDETNIYQMNGFECFSLCIPTKGEMHDNKGLIVRKKSYFKYMKALCMAANM